MTSIKLILLLFINLIFALDNFQCGTTASDNEIISSINAYNKISQLNLNSNREIHWVPVQFHIVQRTDGSGGLNEIVFPGIIDDLNMDYINANIRFYQYGPVDYIQSTEYYNTDGDVEINELKSINGIDDVIDIYAVGSLSSESGALCGISSFTWFGIQGIIVANGCFDRFTVNHEVGHYFNLFHPHEDANGDEYVNGSGCSYRGDGICDTPADPNLSLGGMVNACNYIGTATDPNGQAYDDCQGYEPCEIYGGPDVENIMSYAPDGCVNHFTDEQYIKAENILLDNRPNYISTPNYAEINLESVEFEDIVGDGDFVINPNEIIELIFSINVDEAWPTGAEEIIITLTTAEQNVNFQVDQLYLPSLIPGEVYTNSDQPFIIDIGQNAEFQDYLFNLNLSYLSENGDFFETNFDISLDVSLNQFGFPFNTGTTVMSSPLIFDVDNDNINEIIFGSHAGNLNICKPDMANCNSFNDVGQIWGSPAIADLNLDGEFEIIFGSVDKNIYVINQMGELLYSYDTDQFLVGTPAIGNIDSDEELEIIIGGYTSSSKLFGFNHDLTLVENFPIEINEKMKEGTALADVDNDGLEEIFFGTESDNFYRVNPDGIIFNNTPLSTAGDKIVFSPIIVKQSFDDYLVVFGSDDGNLYGITSEGEEVFTYLTGDKIRSSASVLNFNGVRTIAFGSEDGFVYLIDFMGNNIEGFPLYIGESIETAPVFANVNSDDFVDLIITGLNNVYIYSLNNDVNLIAQFENNQSITGSAAINDFDSDGDMEIFVGTNYNLLGIDFKEAGFIDNYWSMYRGNLYRNGFIDLTLLGNHSIYENLEYQLSEPYPNPFNNNVNFPLYVESFSEQIINIYNIKGEIISQSSFNPKILGINNVEIEFSNNSSGVYFIQHLGNKKGKINKVILLK